MLSQRRWAYDANGRVTAIQDGRWGTTHYAYDRIGQLVSATRGNLREMFEYDGAGSLGRALTALSVDAWTPWSVREGNLLVETDRATYENDAHGRRTKCVDKATGTATEYIWDCRDQLREVCSADGRRVRYMYDAFGRRVRKEISCEARICSPCSLGRSLPQLTKMKLVPCFIVGAIACCASTFLSAWTRLEEGSQAWSASEFSK